MTTHKDPIYIVDGIVHYCVANMPGATARTSTIALGNATLGPFITLIEKGWRKACRDDANLRKGLNVCEGQVTYGPVGEALGFDVVDPMSLL